MSADQQFESNLFEFLNKKKISRRDFFKGCAFFAMAIGLTGIDGPDIVAQALVGKTRPPVIWLEFQDCAGCTESLTRSGSPLLTKMIFDDISLDYHETLLAPSGSKAEENRLQTMERFFGHYILVVEGSVTEKDEGIYCTIGGKSNIQILKECAEGAAAVVAVGNCASFGGIPGAQPAPTGGKGVRDVLKGTVINIPGCPPIAEAITSTFVHMLVFDSIPELDALGRPRALYGNLVHDRCVRRTFYDQGKFAQSFDDEKARQGYCLYMLGCKGPTTHNACPTLRWNGGISYPIQSGHPCLGCSEPKFWDAGSFYAGQSAPLAKPQLWQTGAAVGAGAALGGLATILSKILAKPPKEEQK